MKILIVEDETPIRETIAGYLQQEGYVCEEAADFPSADEKAALYEYDLVVLDITLPGGNGLDVLRTLKKTHPETGVLILSAKNSLEDKITGLDLGADDYLTKPFHLSELNARVKALVRRRFFQGSPTILFEEIEIDPSNNVMNINGQPVELTKKEYDLLLYFITNQNRVLTKAAIAEHLWGDYMDLADNFDLVYSHIKNLRKKIVQNGGRDYIKTVYGMGYKFTGE
ncbi:MAG: response regulator transcription factor [Lewinellaceae bacterium]|nr:response regulator transcription factor [Saprospiraceae bacterium]MCB9339352.1 response regulator transcription factor [Lewinellaceae bacterium]